MQAANHKCYIGVAILYVHMSDPIRIKSISHAEWEILNHMVKSIPIDDLKADHCPDAHASKRFDKAADNLATLIMRMMDTRAKHLPAEHIHFKGD